jgi:hypothetical protein
MKSITIKILFVVILITTVCSVASAKSISKSEQVKGEPQNVYVETTSPVKGEPQNVYVETTSPEQIKCYITLVSCSGNEFTTVVTMQYDCIDAYAVAIAVQYTIYLTC